MATIHPLDLAFVVATHKKVQLIDVRSRAQFNRSHIRGAYSIPLRELRAAKIVQQRSLTNPEPLVVISDRHMRATLAAGLLAAAGCLNPLVLEGGMEWWEAHGLPAVHPSHFRITSFVKRLHSILGLRRDVYVKIMRRMTIPRPADNTWWCRDVFQPREAYRG